MNTNSQANPLLIISASERRAELQSAVEEALAAPVSVAADFTEALAVIAGARFRAVVIDEGLADLNPSGADHFLSRCTDELPIFVKLAISGIPRCLQQIRVSLRRFEREQKIVANASRHSSDSQMRDALTSIFLYAQLALKTPGLPPEASKHLNSILTAGDVIRKSMGTQPERPPSGGEFS